MGSTGGGVGDVGSPGAVELAVEIAGILDGLGVRYVVGGSVASSFVGQPRATMDVDLAVELDAPEAQRLVAALGDTWYVSSERASDAVRRRSSFNLIHLATMVKVDLFVLSDGLLDRRQMQRRRRMQVPSGGELWIGSPEGQILRKLWWYELGGRTSERQWRDVVAMLEVQGDRLDLADLRHAAVELGLAALLEQAQGDATGGS